MAQVPVDSESYRSRKGLLLNMEAGIAAAKGSATLMQPVVASAPVLELLHDMRGQRLALCRKLLPERRPVLLDELAEQRRLLAVALVLKRRSRPGVVLKRVLGQACKPSLKWTCRFRSASAAGQRQSTMRCVRSCRYLLTDSCAYFPLPAIVPPHVPRRHCVAMQSTTKADPPHTHLRILGHGDCWHHCAEHIQGFVYSIEHGLDLFQGPQARRAPSRVESLAR